MVPLDESINEFFGRCFFNRLRAMSVESDDTFIVLMVLLPLYEKHLRIKFGQTTIGLSAQVFEEMEKDLGLDPGQAKRFWDHYRHGLSHRALIKRGVINSNPKPIEAQGDAFVVNPFALRDHLLQIMEPTVNQWANDPQCPPPITYQMSHSKIK